ncbi:hypothetical protein [Amycolatopsis samaneae]|uniref:Uncharacterized protein n=1 Tax=Amycolatopsis samaneae TaxID=664691 RepID=A0ABW5GEW8_9PSEU
MVHFLHASDVVRAREADLRKSAARRAKRPGTQRERLGWALVEIGLRLASERARPELNRGIS